MVAGSGSSLSNNYPNTHRYVLRRRNLQFCLMRLICRDGYDNLIEISLSKLHMKLELDSPTNNERVRKHLTDNASYAPVRESTLETSRRMQVAGRNAHTVATGVVDPRMEGLRSETMWQCFSIGWYKLNSDGVSRTSDGICSVLKAKL
ncbi:hypothetical protein V6N13_128996 [Hibiscus sabdariffa]